MSTGSHSSRWPQLDSRPRGPSIKLSCLSQSAAPGACFVSACCGPGWGTPGFSRVCNTLQLLLLPDVVIGTGISYLQSEFPLC